MFINFFLDLKKAGIAVSITELLSLLSALQKGISTFNVNNFYYLARTALVKDERFYDRFDQVFSTTFHGLDGDSTLEQCFAEIPEEWLRKVVESLLSDEDKAKIEALGGFDELMKMLKIFMRHTKMNYLRCFSVKLKVITKRKK